MVISKKIEWLSLASSVTLLIPVFIGLLYESYTYALIASIAFIGSTLFHLTKPPGPVWWTGGGQTPLQVFFLYVDTVTTLIFASYIAYLLFDEGSLLKILIVLALLIPTFYIYFRGWGNYELEHAMWHIAASMLALAPFI